MEAVLDIMSHMDQIFKMNKRSILDYAAWYLEKHKEVETYAQYIPLITCHCIAHSELRYRGA